MPINTKLTYEELESRVRALESYCSELEAKLSAENIRQYENIVSSTSDGIALLDKDYRYIIVNDAYERFSGIKREHFIGRNVSEYLGEDVFNQFVKPHFDKCLQGDTVIYQEWFEYPSMGRRFVEVTYSPYRDVRNNISGVLSNTRDITERKMAEDALQRVRFSIENLSEGVFWVGETGCFTDVNAAACRKLGYTREELLTMSVADIDPCFPAEQWAPHWEEMKQCGMKVFETVHRAKDGTLIPMELVVHNQIFGKERYNCVLGRDITERRQAEDKLRAEREQLLSVFNSIDDPIYISDPSTHEILYVNRFLQKQLTQDNIGAKCYTVLQGLDAPCPFCTNDIILKQNPQPYYWDFYNQKLDRHYAIVDRIIRWPDGRDVRFEMAKDITEHKRTEKKILALTGRLNLALSSARAGVWDWNIQTNEMIWDDRMLELYGLTRENFPGGVEAWEQGLHPDDAARAIEECQAALRGELDFDTEFRVRRPDGTVILIKANGLVQRDKEGNPIRMIGLNTDITERKATEEALRESEQRLQAVFNAVDGVPIQGYDKYRRVVFWNPASEKLYGYTHDEAIGRPLEELIIPEESRESVVRAIQQWHDQDVPIPAGEIELLHKSGRRLQIYSNHILITNHRGDKEMFCIDVDLTEIRRIEQRMASLSAVVENSDNIVVVKDLDLRVVATNPAFAKATGHATVDTMIGKTDAEIFGVTPDTEPIRSYMEDERRAQMLPPGEYILREEPVVTPDGGVCTVLTKKYPIYDQSGNLIGTGNISTDITERKQAEELQKNLTTELEEILDALPDAVVYADTDRRIKKVNPSFTRIFGYCRDEILGKKTRILYRSDEEYREQGRKRYNPQASQMWEPYEIYHVRKDGTEFLSETVGTPVRDAQGRVVGLLGLVRDITEKKQSESENENLQAQLRQAQKMEAVGRLAGGVAHDYNNMLSVILGYSEMLLETFDPQDDAHAATAEIQKAARRSTDITRQLLAFARQQTIAPKVLDLNDTVQGMLKMMRRLIGEDIDLAWMPGASLWPVKMDPSQVDQILANLCVNARDAIGGVGKVTIETENRCFDAAYCANHPGAVQGEYILLAVSDDGYGMDRETLQKIFEPFFTTKAEGQGTGLGLATVYGIVKQNEGFVNVYSEPGKGTTFRIYLPREASEAAEDRVDAPVEPPRSRGETVLLVEDEVPILKLGKQMLQSLGYDVLTSNSPEDALDLAKRHEGRIDILVTDVVMPAMSGRDLSHRLVELYPALKTLYMSGYTANVIAHRGVLDEGVHFIAKPFSKIDLAFKLRGILDNDVQ